MSGTLFEKNVNVRRVSTIGSKAAQALNDPVRIKILEILSHKQMSAEEIVKCLDNSDYKRATTTIRHHLDSLKSAGLIQASKMIEVRGAVLKYYSPTLQAFSYEAPLDFETKYAKLIDDTASRMLKVLKNVFEDKKFALTSDIKNRCNLCKNDHFKEFLALEIVNAALAKAMRRNEYSQITTKKETSNKPSKV